MTLYLKYRPYDFETLIGQNFVKNTLKQAIIQNKMVGAYLFCGPRGTGKTSSARIFAKAMNCLDLQNGNPCGKCKICQGFINNNLVDIVEIDAASYTGVDNIREIIQNAKFSPTICKYKVYIIDEVHMLSGGAFNALLKILEEPPEHVKFILATTEIHKVPETILSRCQRYDFQSLRGEDIKKCLLFIGEKEGIEIDEESIDYIIKVSAGGMRNAISLLEQLNIDGKVKMEDINKSLGIPKKEQVENFTKKIFLSDISVIDDFESISAQFHLSVFMKELLFFLKDRLIENMKLGQNIQRHIFLLETLDETYGRAKNSFDAKTTYLVGILKCFEQNNIGSSSPVQKIAKTEQTNEIKAPKIMEQKDNKPKKVAKTETISEELDFSDVVDIFHNDISDLPTENIDTKTHFPNDTFSFDTKTFVEHIKNLGAKGATTMTLRGANISLENGKCIIQPATKMAQKHIIGDDIRNLMLQALSKMGYSEIEIIIK